MKTQTTTQPSRVRSLFLSFGCLLVAAATSPAHAQLTSAPPQAVAVATTPVMNPEQAWKMRLTEEQYRHLREGATEKAFSGDLWNHHEHGVYRCAACGQAVYHSKNKYDAGTGWPSFSASTNPDALDTRPDYAFGRARVEVSCSRCKSHLGFVYDRGPAPTGLRHSINSVALAFDPSGKKRAPTPQVAWHIR